MQCDTPKLFGGGQETSAIQKRSEDSKRLLAFHYVIGCERCETRRAIVELPSMGDEWSPVENGKREAWGPSSDSILAYERDRALAAAGEKLKRLSRNSKIPYMYSSSQRLGSRTVNQFDLLGTLRLRGTAKIKYAPACSMPRQWNLLMPRDVSVLAVVELVKLCGEVLEQGHVTEQTSNNILPSLSLRGAPRG